jgi:hypothetical protein
MRTVALRVTDRVLGGAWATLPLALACAPPPPVVEPRVVLPVATVAVAPAEPGGARPEPSSARDAPSPAAADRELVAFGPVAARATAERLEGEYLLVRVWLQSNDRETHLVELDASALTWRRWSGAKSVGGGASQRGSVRSKPAPCAGERVVVVEPGPPVSFAFALGPVLDATRVTLELTLPAYAMSCAPAAPIKLSFDLPIEL